MTAQNVTQTRSAYPELASAGKVIVPVEFTAYESGSIREIQNQFTGLEILTTCYEAGDVELDMNGPVVSRINAIGKTLDEALVYARSLSYNNNPNTTAETFGYNDARLIICPPLQKQTWNDIYEQSFRYSNKLVYIGSLLGNVTKLGMDSPFGWTSPNFVYFGATDVAKVTTFGCQNRQYVSYIGLYNIKSNIAVNNTSLGHDALVVFLNNLADVTEIGTRTVTIGSAKLALLSADEIAIATNKGWQVQ